MRFSILAWFLISNILIAQAGISTFHIQCACKKIFVSSFAPITDPCQLQTISTCCSKKKTCKPTGLTKSKCCPKEIKYHNSDISSILHATHFGIELYANHPVQTPFHIHIDQIENNILLKLKHYVDFSPPPYLASQYRSILEVWHC